MDIGKTDKQITNIDYIVAAASYIAIMMTVLLPTAATARASADFDERNDIVVEFLGAPLWRDRDAYDAAHYLMVPMHEAFQSGRRDRILAFRNFFENVVQHRQELVVARRSRLQFLYLASRFLVLEVSLGACDGRIEPVMELISAEADHALKSPAWLWGRPDFDDMFARLTYKLSEGASKPRYLKALFDEELFTLAIASDLVLVARRCSFRLPSTVTQANEIHFLVWTRLGEFRGPHWHFQPGVWADHPDFRHAGHESLGPSLSPRPVQDIGWDTSHSTRHPAFLLSAACGHLGANRARLNEIRERLARTFTEIVLVPPSAELRAYLTRNFMTGENGVYRYSYRTKGKGGGYGPYQLSGTFQLGWWSFASDQMKPIYQEQLTLMPFAPHLRAYFADGTVTEPSQARPRHPLLANDSDRSSLEHAIVKAASVLSAKAMECTEH